MGAPETQGLGVRFAANLVLPAATLAGYFVGGAWTWAGFVAYLVCYVAIDAAAPHDLHEPPRTAGLLRDVLLFAQLPLVAVCWLWFAALFRVGGGYDLFGAAASLTVTIAINGTVTAHELVHRTSSPASLAAGRLLLAFILDAAFSIEHVYGHHARVATADDAATARRGENVYAFFWRSTTRSFVSAWAIEAERLARRRHALWSWHNRNLRGVGLSLLLIVVSVAIGGLAAGAAFVAVAVFAKFFLEMTNYVEHYGLVRAPGTPVAQRHSWDTAARFSAIGMFNLGRHAAHHMKGNQPYWALPLAGGAPKMLSGVPASAIIAAVPPVWFRMMRSRLARWDRDCASDGERTLLGIPNRRGVRSG